MPSSPSCKWGAKATTPEIRTGAECVFKEREKTKKSGFRMGNTRKGLAYWRKRSIPNWVDDWLYFSLWFLTSTNLPSLGLNFVHLDMWGRGLGEFWNPLHFSSALREHHTGKCEWGGGMSSLPPLEGLQAVQLWKKRGNMNKTENVYPLWPSNVTLRHVA